MHTHLTSLRSAVVGIQKLPLIRRLFSSLMGALIALTGFSVYQHTSAMIVSIMNDRATMHSASSEHQDAAARVKAFAEIVKKQRADSVK